MKYFFVNLHKCNILFRQTKAQEIKLLRLFILFYLLLQAVEIFRVKKFGKCYIKTVTYLFYR